MSSSAEIFFWVGIHEKIQRYCCRYLFFLKATNGETEAEGVLPIHLPSNGLRTFTFSKSPRFIQKGEKLMLSSIPTIAAVPHADATSSRIVTLRRILLLIYPLQKADWQFFPVVANLFLYPWIARKIEIAGSSSPRVSVGDTTSLHSLLVVSQAFSFIFSKCVDLRHQANVQCRIGVPEIFLRKFSSAASILDFLP